MPLELIRPRRSIGSAGLTLCAALCILGTSVPANAKEAIRTFASPKLLDGYAWSVNRTGSITLH